MGRVYPVHEKVLGGERTIVDGRRRELLYKLSSQRLLMEKATYESKKHLTFLAAIISEAEIEHVMNQRNHRPRKTLGFRTRYEVFFNTRTPLTVVLTS